MNQDEVLHKIHEDLELLKKDVAEIKEVILIEPELREEIKTQIAEARERISKGKFVRHEDIQNVQQRKRGQCRTRTNSSF